MKEKIIKILQWILCVFMAILALALIPSVASVFLALFCVILIPVEKVQALWKRLHIQGAKKIGVLALLFLAAVFTTPADPNANQPSDIPDDTKQSAQSMQSTLPMKSENKYEGELTLDFSFGTRTGVYSGEVDSDGHPNGQGTFTSKNQNGEIWTYEGDWVAGHWEGHGTSTWWDGRVYTGEFTNDSETGYGTVTTNTGEKYEGTFIFGTICGEGTLYCTDGTKFVGTFTDFENATGTYYDKDESSQEATIKGGSFSWQQTEKNESENTQQLEAQTNSENGTTQPSEGNTESEAQPEEPVNEKEKDDEIESILRAIVRGNYTYTNIDSISINPNLGTDVEEDYVALVYLTWSQKNNADLTQKVLSMYSEDFAARIGQSAPSVSEFAVFWTVPFHSETETAMKFTYERRGEGMYETDRWNSFATEGFGHR